MPVNDVYQLEVCYTIADQWALCRFNFKNTTNTSGNPLDVASDLCQTWLANLNGPWDNIQANNYYDRGIRARRVQSPGDSQGGPTASFLSDTAGGYDTDCSTSITCAVVLWPYQDGDSDAYRMGRTFIPGPADEVLDGNIFTSGYLTNIGVWADLLVAPLVGDLATWQFGVLSHKDTGEFYQVTDWSMSGGPGTQRDRGVPLLGKPSRSSHHRASEESLLKRRERLDAKIQKAVQRRLAREKSATR